MVKEKVEVTFVCKECGGGNHKWHEVYFSEGAKLKKAEKSFIAMCKVLNEFVLITVNL